MPETVNVSTPRKNGDIRIKNALEEGFSVNSDSNLTVVDVNVEAYAGKVGFMVGNSGANDVDITIEASYKPGNSFPGANAYDKIAVETAVTISAGTATEFTLPPLSPYRWLRLSAKRTSAGLTSTINVYFEAQGRS